MMISLMMTIDDLEWDDDEDEDLFLNDDLEEDDEGVLDELELELEGDEDEEW